MTTLFVYDTGIQVIRRIRDETGAKVIIYNTVERCDERVLKCRSMDDTAAPVCAAQEAMTRALFCLFKNEVGGLDRMALVERRGFI